MDEPQQPPDQPDESLAVPIVWAGPEDVPILFANAFVCQFDPTLDAHILTVGQLTPPALIGATRDELRHQAEQIAFVTVKPIARIAFTPARMQELRAMLDANSDQRDTAANLQPGDPR